MKKSFLLLPILALLTGCSVVAENPNLTRQPVAADTKVTVVEFSDFNCPACREAQPVASELKALPGVHFELRHYPLPIRGHETSFDAAIAYECAVNQGKGDALAAALFGTQGAGFAPDMLLDLPKVSGLTSDPTFNEITYQTCVKNKETQSLVSRDAGAAKRANLSFTPTFVVDGVPLSTTAARDTILQKLGR